MTSGEGRRSTPVRHEVLGRRIAPGAVPVGDFTYSVIEILPKAPSGEKRRGRRIRSHLREATVREVGGRSVVECRIRDLSDDGARLQLDHEWPLPKIFLLRAGTTNQSFRATLVWQLGRDAGVKLISTGD